MQQKLKSRNLSWLSRQLRALGFSWIQLLTALVVTAITTFCVIRLNCCLKPSTRQPSDFWTLYLDPAITIATFLFALSIFFLNLMRNWKTSLKHRLTVHFVMKMGKETEREIDVAQGRTKDSVKKALPFCWNAGDTYVLLSCYESPLQDENDARQWALQIGQQMNENNQLNLKAFFSFRKRRIRSLPPYVNSAGRKTKREDFHLHTLIYYLSKVPECLDKKLDEAIATNTKTSSPEMLEERKIKRKVWIDNLDDMPDHTPIERLPVTMKLLLAGEKNPDSELFVFYQ